MKSLIIILYLFTFQSIIAQADFGKLANQQSVREELGVIGSGKMINGYGFNNDYKGILGSPFLFDDWAAGVLVLSAKPDKIYTNVQLKFDSYKNELWLLFEKDSSILYSKDVISFALGSGNKPFREFTMPDRSKKFCQVIYSDSTYILIKEERKILIKSNYVNKGMYATGDKYDRFKDDSRYYISKEGDLFKPFNMKKSSFEALTPKNRIRDLKSFMNREKFDNTLTDGQAIVLFQFLLEN